MAVFINNLQDKVKFDAVSSELIEKAVEVVLELEHFTQDPEVSISLVDDEHIRELNLTYRQKDSSTDVLSFPLLEEDEEQWMEEGEDDPELLLGDIVISLETAVKQAEEYGHTLERELAFLTVHGMLHLLGHDHYEEDETILMRSKEKEAMAVLKLFR